MGVVVDPFPGSRNPLARRNHGGVADDGDEVAVPARLGAQNAKTVIAVVEGDALDETGQNFLCCGLWLGFHFCRPWARQSQGISNVPDHILTLALRAFASSAT